MRICFGVEENEDVPHVKPGYLGRLKVCILVGLH